MLQVYVALTSVIGAWWEQAVSSVRHISARRTSDGEKGQTTAEYALVILAAAAVAVVLIAWARSSGKLPAFFDEIIDDISGNAQ